MSIKLRIALPILAALAAPVFAADYPEKTIRLYHGFGPGGNADTVARIVAEEMSQGLGQPVVVESKPGAGGTVASDFISKADPDGYSLQLMVGGHSVAAALYNELPYDAKEDFTFISTIGKFPFFAATQAGAFDDMADLVAQAKEKPGSIKIGHAGVGSTQHLSGELLGLLSGAEFLHIPYKGGAAASTALLGGEVDLMIDAGTSTRGQAEAGTFDILGVTSGERWDDATDVPTISETVAEGYDVLSWTGLGGPAGLSDDVVATLSAEMARVMALPSVQEKITALGAKPSASTPEEFRTLVETQIGVWTTVVKDAGVEKR
ncbi:tripartite-type tricarboxylate transporter receptor subunit TctC [Pacificibacter maritimus]|uniref:Tripartite-type tricarboxylate transporter receptor subunit TctC n=1 Tax=Pacificibacter maritimus TaxID=762213 RepID=A0A3N4UCB7_9RHOB|nr:tripartite tricarboxylate transporter substrate-binding protein [Pacificibacter maritimus]RPE62947.1 tripartite-type tricarboxylate transporter receptor subunit TctC [Pacificibacter maritimus]